MLFKRRQNQDDSFWISAADLMACLMVLFMFIAGSYIWKVQKEGGSIGEARKKYEESKEKIYIALKNEFDQELKEGKITLDKESLTITFPDGDSLFESGSAKPNSKFENMLYSFLPRYIKILHDEKVRDNISEIHIEGHTSSGWQFATSQLNAYFLNMELSQGRTREVLKYMLGHQQLQEDTKWIEKHITANGLSSSRPITKKDKDGNYTNVEDREKSRRIEFRILTKSVIDKLQDQDSDKKPQKRKKQ